MNDTGHSQPPYEEIIKEENNPGFLTEKNFKDLVQSSPDAVFVYVDGKIIFANNTGLRLFRADKPEDLIGRRIWDLIPPESHQSLKKAINLIINNRRSYISSEDRIITVDGHLVDIEISSTYFNFNGRHGIQAFIRNISKRKETERQLKKSEKEYKEIFESTGTAIFFIEEDRTISLINGECEKITGYSRSDIEGRMKWHEFIASEDRWMLEKTRGTPGDDFIAPMNVEFRLVDRDRSYHNVFMTVTNVPGTKRSVASIIDLTGIQKAEEILAAARQNYRILIENTKEAIAIIQDELVRYVNPMLCRITGYEEKQILNKKFYKLVHRDFTEIVKDEYRHRLDGTVSKTTFPVKIIDTVNRERWFQINSVLTVRAQRPAVLLFFNDITETKEAQNALQASEEKYRLLAENAKDIIITYGEDGKLKYMNHSGLRTFRLGETDISSINIRDILADKKQFLRFPPGKNKDAGNRTYENSIEFINPDNERILLETVSSPVKLDSENTGMLVIARDVTERKKLEKEIISLSERIRQQVSRDLHDDLNPHLIGIEALARVLALNLKTRNYEEYIDAEKIVTLLNRASTKTHRLARGLCPVDLDASEIQTPLIDLIRLIRTLYGIECRFTYDDSVTLKDITLATNLYYIAQEAAFNAARYSGGTGIHISLQAEGDYLILKIEDNGMGLPEQDRAADGRKGMGLKIMKYRAGIIDGAFNIETGRPSGTSVTVKMPLSTLQSEGKVDYDR